MAATMQRLMGLGLAWIGIAIALLWPSPALAAPMLSPSLASIHTYHERADQTTYRSRLTLPDRNDQAWQATLFHRFAPGADQGPYLRLVAFPGTVVAPTAALTVKSGSGRQWLAPANDATLPPDRPNNIGQYDFTQVLPALQSPIPLTLEVPLAGGRTRQLVVAPFVVEEWQQLEALAASEAAPQADYK